MYKEIAMEKQPNTGKIKKKNNQRKNKESKL